LLEIATCMDIPMNSSPLVPIERSTPPIAAPTDPAQVAKDTSPAARVVLAVFMAIFVLVLTLLFVQPLSTRTLLAYLLAIPGVALLPALVLVCRKGPEPANTVALAAGMVFIWIGVAFDIFATLWHSPDLAREANPAIRAFADSGHSLALSYVYLAGVAVVSSLALSIWWAIFLRHKEALLALSFRAEPQSFARFFKAATGGAALSWRQYFLPMKLAELPAAYPVVVGYGPFIVLMATFAHIYAALIWFRLVSHPSIVGVLLWSTLLALAVYAVWLHRAFARHRAAAAGTSAGLGPVEPRAENQ
jgi:hypothetical protein